MEESGCCEPERICLAMSSWMADWTFFWNRIWASHMQASWLMSLRNSSERTSRQSCERLKARGHPGRAASAFVQLIKSDHAQSLVRKWSQDHKAESRHLAKWTLCGVSQYELRASEESFEWLLQMDTGATVKVTKQNEWIGLVDASVRVQILGRLTPQHVLRVAGSAETMLYSGQTGLGSSGGRTSQLWKGRREKRRRVRTKMNTKQSRVTQSLSLRATSPTETLIQVKQIFKKKSRSRTNWTSVSSTSHHSDCWTSGT